MIKEIALLTIDPAKSDSFEKTFLEVAPVLRRQPGYLYDEFLRVVENDCEYILIVHWENVESHKAFVESDDFKLLAGPWGPFQKEAAVRHCRLIAHS
ncbi:MAG: antibiotic biosynthesis monooxygenase [Spirochaetales bacterium]|nr:MAG: antibiotic biosynthesis monooxygenase [Spirochaetales bacterium]